MVLIAVGLFCVADTSALPAAILDNASGDTVGWILVVLGVLAIVSVPAAAPKRSRQEADDVERPRVPTQRRESPRLPQSSLRRPPLR